MVGSPTVPVIATAVATTAGAAFAAVEWSSTIPVLIVTVIGIGTITASIYGIKSKVTASAASSAADELRKSLADARADREELRTELREAHEVMLEQRGTIERLERLPDFTRLVELMAETSHRQEETGTRRMDDALLVIGRLAADHERQAETRHDQLIEAIGRGRT